ncbi:MAG: nodulation protein NfeD, partial [Gammaproteobacteria bacterium]|nr:nodulation protein NfeD [Gammaproteobacteria bacterium]
ALIFIFIVGMAVKARRRPVVSGLEGLIGGDATVVNDFDHKGTVIIHSENWQAMSDTPLHKNQQVKVIDVKGLILHVEPLGSSKQGDES